MVNAIVMAIEDPPPGRIRIVDVPAIKRAGESCAGHLSRPPI
jgi:hypothetical protein